MGYDVFGVYLVDFKENFGAEFSGKHYAVVLTKASGDNFNIECNKYQDNPSTLKAFVRIKKIREIDIRRIYGGRIYLLDDEDIEKLRKSFYQVFKFLL